MDRDVRIIQYADDITLLVFSTSIKVAWNKIQAALNNVQEYLISKGLNLAPAKSQVMVFGNSRKNLAPLSVRVSEMVISTVDKARFLGVMLYRFLSGKEHLRFLRCNGKKLVDVTASLAGI